MIFRNAKQVKDISAEEAGSVASVLIQSTKFPGYVVASPYLATGTPKDIVRNLTACQSAPYLTLPPTQPLRGAAVYQNNDCRSVGYTHGLRDMSYLTRMNS